MSHLNIDRGQNINNKIFYGNNLKVYLFKYIIYIINNTFLYYSKITQLTFYYSDLE